MNSRTLISGLAILLAILPASTYAQVSRSGLPSWGPWEDFPAIVVVSTGDDSRLPAAREAVDFWNAEFSKLGSPFRLGSVAHVIEMIPAGDLRDLRDPSAVRVLSRIAPAGDVIVALSNDANFNPFTRPGRHKVVVAIPDLWVYGRTLPGLVRNVIAHELGHVVGLGHNDDPTALMCGKAECARARGLMFPNEGFRPITQSEKTKLLEMYPPNWQPKPFKKWITDPPYPPTSG